MSIHNKLGRVQAKLKVGKGHRNDFGNYNYRNLADIFEGLKPILSGSGCSITVSDEIVCVNDFNYIKATATFSDGNESITTTGWARESVQKKGMDDSQITGATSSYARKYALNGLFAIDDTEDADSMDNRDHKTVVVSPSLSKKPNEEVQQASDEWNEASRNTGIPFGKYKGTPWKDVPEDYIGWLINKSDNANWRAMANAELVARMTEGASEKQQDVQQGVEADSSTKEADKGTEKGWVVEDDSKISPKLEDQIQEGKELMEEFSEIAEGDDDDLPF
jgi:hypothetical protein